MRDKQILELVDILFVRYASDHRDGAQIDAKKYIDECNDTVPDNSEKPDSSYGFDNEDMGGSFM